MHPAPTSARHMPLLQPFEPFFFQESESCVKSLHTLFAQEALRCYADEKSGDIKNPDQVKRFYVESNIPDTFEQIWLNPARLLKHIEADVCDSIKGLQSPKKEFFYALREKTIATMRHPEHNGLARMICHCEFDLKKKIVKIDESKLLNYVVLKATDLFFQKAQNQPSQRSRL